jgi:hypothetical protein
MQMRLFLRRFEKHLPLLLGLVYLISGDYGGLIRHIRLLL